jgi:hypothetical protein
MSETKQPQAPIREDELGPIDVLVLTWPPDAPMNGEAAPLLRDLADKGTIRIFDAMFVTKAADGTVAGFQAKDLTDKDVGNFDVFEGSSSGVLSDANVRQAAESIDPGWSAAVIVYENRWAAPFATAVRRNGGQVMNAERISPAELVEVLNAS